MSHNTQLATTPFFLTTALVKIETKTQIVSNVCYRAPPIEWGLTMPRPKSLHQVETLERQQKELAEKLKAAKAARRDAEREARIECAKIAGLAFLDELAENPNGDPARLLLSLLDRRLTRRADRARFGIVEAPVLGKDGGNSSTPVDAVAGE